MSPSPFHFHVTLEGLGLLYHLQGRYAEAEPPYLRALAIRERTMGPDHLLVRWSLLTYAELLHAIGRETEAADAERRALGIWLKRCPEHARETEPADPPELVAGTPLSGGPSRPRRPRAWPARVAEARTASRR
jgi:hypothetical protein